MNEEYARFLRDIRGLDEMGWWPPAPGWWLVFAAMVVAVVLTWLLSARWLSRRTAWRYHARRRLRQLRAEAQWRDPKEVLSGLSALLRVVAMARFGRRDCAGLTGVDWLGWLSEHDPQRFDWSARGPLLLRLPYAPGANEADRRELGALIDAVERWVDAEEKSASRLLPGLVLRREVQRV